MSVFLSPLETGERIVLDKAVILIGRHPDCDLVIDHSAKVSRRHCCIAQVDDRFLVRDLGSMNGVRINGELIDQESPLVLGDTIAFGDVSYVLESPEIQAAKNHEDREDQKVTASETDRQKPSKRKSPPRLPTNLSQDFPVPIDDGEGEEFAVEPSIIGDPDEIAHEAEHSSDVVHTEDNSSEHRAGSDASPH
ncbi:MAG: hypothetical protein Tsb009_33880 [Planctomycetaceae bacterium]